MMFSNVPDTDLPTLDMVDPTELVPLADLAAEGFSYDAPAYITTPKDAIDVLAHQLGDQVILDDLGRRCVTRDTARALFAERADAEQRQREAQKRHDAEAAELAAKNPPRRGVPADAIPAGMTAAEAFAAAELADAPRRTSVLEEALGGGGLVFHPIRNEEES